MPLLSGLRTAVFFGSSPNIRGELACLLARYHEPLSVSHSTGDVGSSLPKWRSTAPSMPTGCFAAESVRVNAQRSASLSQKSSVNETRSLVPSSQRNSIRQRTTVVRFLS